MSGSEQAGAMMRDRKRLADLEDEIYKASLAIVVMVEKAEDKWKEQKYQEVEQLLGHIKDRVEYMKGYGSRL